MKIVAFNGSARKGGNTADMLKAALAPLADQGFETELVEFAGKKFKGCIACNKCWEKQNRLCAVDNDFVNECIAKMDEADGVLLGSPTYFANVTTEMKAFIDRAGYVALANGSMFARKVGAAVVAARRGGAIHVFNSINHLFFINQMIVPGSRYWNMGFGLDKGDVQEDGESNDTMKLLGENMAWLLKKLHA